MLRWPRIAWTVASLLVLTFVTFTRAETPASADKPEDKKQAAGKFLRLLRDAQGRPTALETAVVRYQSASGEGDLVVDLVSVVHLGDRAYYGKLNKVLDGYDVVLYELVAPEGTRIPKGGGHNRDNPLALLQQLATQVLNLEWQTDRIDYTRKHFVHADLSPEGMARALSERGEDGLTLFLGLTADLLRQQNLEARKPPKKLAWEAEDVDLFSLLLDPRGSINLKRLFAEQLVDAETPDGGLPQTLSNLLIVDRNKAALKVFQKELAKGRKKIAIFYGAGHMPDFEQRLKAEFGLKRVSEKWLTAWDLRDRR